MEGIESLLSGLDDQQRAAVTSPAASLCVHAAAGSGKTTVLTRRIARRATDESLEPRHTLALTFTRKAADELSERLRRMGLSGEITTGTFHAVAYAQLRQRWIDQGRTVPVVASQPARMLDTVLQTLRLERAANPKTIAAEISWAKSRRLTPDTYEAGVRQYKRRPPLSFTQIARVYDAYESEKRKRRTVDFDDLLMLMTDAMQKDRAFAAAQRWRFRHLFVDEFQDLNKAQFDLLRSWLGDRDDLFVVGDPNQAIYGWNGADAAYLLDIERHFPGIETVALQTNYRSTRNVLAAASAVLPNAPGASSVNKDEGYDESAPPPTIAGYGDDHEEALGIARQIRAAHGRSWRWSDIAILTRTNAQRIVIEQALDDANIPFRSAGGAAWLYRPEVRGALEHLREMPRIRLAQRAADIEQMAQEAMSDDKPAPREYLDELNAAIRQCLQSDPEMTVADFLSWVEVACRNDGPAAGRASGGAVTVTTFHRAKGLEWAVVFLAGLEDGLVPHSASNEAQLEGERRVFYVAITRARNELHCSWAHKRETSAGVALREPSPWLVAIQRSITATPTPKLTQEVVRDAIDKSRAVLVDEQAQDNGATAAIERWRAARSKLTGIEARLILSDDVISRIVTTNPQSLEQLGGIEGFGKVRAASIGEQLLDLLKPQT